MATRKMKTYFGGTVEKLEKGKTYGLMFTYCTSTSRMLFRLNDTPNLKKKLQPLLKYYKEHPDRSVLRIPPEEITIQQMVAVIPEQKEKLPFRGTIHRIMNENGKVTLAVLNIDLGKCYECNVEEIYHILEEFVEIPIDMIDSVLDGLLTFYSNSVYGKALATHRHLLRGITVQAKCEGYWQPPNEREKPLLKIRLEDGTDFNKIVLQTIYSLCRGTLPPPIRSSKRSKQPEVKVGPVKCFPCHVETTGEVFVHLEQSFATEMENLLKKVSLEELLKRGNEYKAGELSKDAVYIAPLGDGPELYRAKFLGIDTPGPDGTPMALVYYMDYGNEDIVPVSVIRAAQLVDKNLEKIPPLCHQVYLKWIQDFIDVGAAQDEVMGQMYHLTVRQEKRDEFPVVVLNQTNPDGVEICLNKFLIENQIASPGNLVEITPQAGPSGNQTKTKGK